MTPLIRLDPQNAVRLSPLKDRPLNLARAADRRHAAGARRVSATRIGPTSSQVVTEFQSDTARTDSPVRILYAQAGRSVSAAQNVAECAGIRSKEISHFRSYRNSDMWSLPSSSESTERCLMPLQANQDHQWPFLFGLNCRVRGFDPGRQGPHAVEAVAPNRQCIVRLCLATAGRSGADDWTRSFGM
jgi:hypothetical protein